MRKQLGSYICVFLLGLALTSCGGTEVVKAPTQVTLRIDTGDSALLAQLTALRTSVALREGSSWRQRTSATVAKSELRWPVDIPITPRNRADSIKEFEVVVEALAGERVLAQTRAIAAFVPNEHKVLALTLFVCPGHEPGYTCSDAACQGEDCSVCARDGTCVPVGTHRPEDLTPGELDDGGVDAGASSAQTGADTGPVADGGSSPSTDAAPGTDLDADAQPSSEAGQTDGGNASILDASSSDAGYDSGPDAAMHDSSMTDAASPDDGMPDASTDCQSNFKRCGTACIPVAQCCEDSDCANGAHCRQGVCKYWCEEQVRPADVLAADYQCLDFERGLPSATTWVRSPSTEGSVSISTSRAFSLPASVLTLALPGDTDSLPRAAMLAWQTQGATPVKQISVAASLSPAVHQTIAPEPLVTALICIKNAQIEVCLQYSYGAEIWTLDGPVPNYRGLYISRGNFVGAYIPHDCVLAQPISLLPNVWNQVVFTVGKPLELWVNGVKGDLGSCGSDLTSDTNATVSFGAKDNWGWSVHYDNVQVTVRR